MVKSSYKKDVKCNASLRKAQCHTHFDFHSSVDEIDEGEQHDNKCYKGSKESNTVSDSNVNEDSKMEKSWKDGENASFRDFFKVELTRGYLLEHDEERYSDRRQKVYSFMRIPRDLERFMVYGIMQCADSFLYIHTFLPLRFLLAMWSMLTKPLKNCLGLGSSDQSLLKPAETCDLLKSAIWIIVTLLMISVDTNRVYHIIKSQSIIKLYIFYNMLEVGDRLLSAFGQDTIDALFWTATEPKSTKREHFGLIPHIIFALIYVMLHSFLIMFQATTLNVAVNSNNKGLLTIMISNNFVELKGSVFKKFDKNNLFQLTCSDVRERFHLSVLLFIVIIQTMKEFDWNFAQFCIMLPDCFAVFLTEILIDWIKHAFITRFNELPECVYREYTTSLAYDMTQTRQKYAFSDHSDLVARRMGFIPFPLGVVLIKAIFSAVSLDNLAAWILFILSFIFILALRILLTICALGKACKLMKSHQQEKCVSSTYHSHTLNSDKYVLNSDMDATVKTHTTKNFSLKNVNFTNTLSDTSRASETARNIGHVDITSNNIITSIISLDKVENNCAEVRSNSSSVKTYDEVQLNMAGVSGLGATPLFSNSDVDLDKVSFPEDILKTSTTLESDVANNLDGCDELVQRNFEKCTNPLQTNLSHKNQVIHKCHVRSESEPNMITIIETVIKSNEPGT